MTGPELRAARESLGLTQARWRACTYCRATNREIAVIGDPNHCQNAADHLAQGGKPHV